ncbi:unnamed protein product [marine sediment metagenome]|uniref:DUF1353 domain-containing protein n=1 Tax=marine sediment metagenome TaxID=412755 RepID=X0WLN7_9ZZZZ
MIKYKAGYKYQLTKTSITKVNIKPLIAIDIERIRLTEKGALVIRKGYCWDGPSGPAIDTKNFMRGSLIHDALYQLMRMELLGQEFRDDADEELRKICLEDGMSKIRAWWVYKAVRGFAKRSALPENKRKELTAP